MTVATVRVDDSATTLDEQRGVRTRIHEHLADRGIDHATVELVGAADTAEEFVGATDHAH